MSKENALFVVGSPRSGTTLLRRILNTHPEIFISRETQYLLFEDLTPRRLTAQEIRDLHARIVPHLRQEGWQSLPTLEQLLAARSLTDLIRYVALAELPDSKGPIRYWGDNTPRYVFIIPFIRDLVPSARFIHIVRDPRDVYASLRTLHIGSNSALTFSLEWMRYIAVIGGASMARNQNVASTLLTIRYEDLVLNTEDVLREVAEFLQLPALFDANRWDKSDAELAGRFSHHRLLARPLDASRIGRYRHVLSPRDIAIIEEVTLPIIRELRYPLGCEGLYGYRQLELMPLVSATVVSRWRRWRRRLARMFVI